MTRDLSYQPKLRGDGGGSTLVERTRLDPVRAARIDALVAAASQEATLDHIEKIFGLNERELASVFNVTPPTMSRWRRTGVPIARAAEIDRVHKLARYCARLFRPSRVPQIVREPGYGLANKSVLQVIRESGVEPIYAYLEQLLSYAPR
jgi:hypothetical protein